jgi:hypothetical protein
VNEEEALTNLPSTEYSATVWLNVRSYGVNTVVTNVSCTVFLCFSVIFHVQIIRVVDVLVVIYLQIILVVNVLEDSEFSLNLTTL